MSAAARDPTVRLHFEYWPLIWLWPIGLVLMQLTLLRLDSFQVTLSVVVCHLMQLYILMLYWLRRPPDGQVVMAFGIVVYTLGLGMFARDFVEFGRSLAQVLNLVVMVVICLNAPLARRPEVRRSVGVFCVAATGAALVIIAQAVTFNLNDFQLLNVLGPLAPIGPGNEVYDVTLHAPPPRPSGFDPAFRLPAGS